jgi:hypothetical protein
MLNDFGKIGTFKANAGVERRSYLARLTQRVMEELLFQQGHRPLVRVRDEDLDATDGSSVFFTPLCN